MVRELAAYSTGSLLVQAQKRAHLQPEWHLRPALAHLQLVHLPLLAQPQLIIPGPPVSDAARANSRTPFPARRLAWKSSRTPSKFASMGSILSPSSGAISTGTATAAAATSAAAVPCAAAAVLIFNRALKLAVHVLLRCAAAPCSGADGVTSRRRFSTLL